MLNVTTALEQAATLLDGATRHGLDQDDLPDRALFALHETTEIQHDLMRLAGLHWLPLVDLHEPCHLYTSRCVEETGRGMREVKESGDLLINIRDEVWKQMRLGVAAVQNLDADLRLSRRDGEVNWMIGHKPGDSAGAGNTGTAARAIASELLALADIKILHGQEARVADELQALIGFSPLVHDLITGWATQRPGRAVWCVGPRLYKVQTVLHPIVKALAFTNQALEGAA